MRPERVAREPAVAAAWTAELLRSVRTGGWVGEAAVAFAATAAVLPVPFEVAAGVFGAASGALADYAQELRAGRVQAGRAAVVWADGERASGLWRQDRLSFALSGVSAGGVLVPALRDPGEHGRAEAGRVLAVARERVELAGDRAARVLRDGCTEAARTRLVGFAAFARGALDSVVGTGRLLWELSVPALLVDRDDAVAARTGLVTGVAQTVRHPREAVAAEVARWRQDPAYAAGGALPDVVLALLTAGGAGAAARAGRVSAAGPRPGGLVTAVVRPVPDSGWTSFIGYRWELVAAGPRRPQDRRPRVRQARAGQREPGVARLRVPGDPDPAGARGPPAYFEYFDHDERDIRGRSTFTKQELLEIQEQLLRELAEARR